jgi:hypothetical protein
MSGVYLDAPPHVCLGRAWLQRALMNGLEHHAAPTQIRHFCWISIVDDEPCERNLSPSSFQVVMDAVLHGSWGTGAPATALWAVVLLELSICRHCISSWHGTLPSPQPSGCANANAGGIFWGGGGACPRQAL